MECLTAEGVRRAPRSVVMFSSAETQASNASENITTAFGARTIFYYEKIFLQKNGHNNLGRGSYARFTFFECFFAEM